VKQLHDLTLYTTHRSRPGLAGDDHQAVLAEVKRRPIQVNCLRIPVVYEDVLSIVPGLHARPPLPPPSHDEKEFPISTPPSQGYDLVFHIGAGHTGGVQVEGLGHKLGYNLKDAKGKLAPVVSSSQHSKVSVGAGNGSKAQERERKRLGAHAVDSRHSRGFGDGYEEFDEELFTEVDIDRLVHDIRATGFKVCFIYYFLSIF
jgi:pyroglutamyl-peptidase